ncbi:MAG: hypothetical protein QOE81_1797 [Verrucomicrobiota bacterium]|jgi:uncharacterized membrane protein YdjX (TVP38/TMEM64 family)
MLEARRAVYLQVATFIIVIASLLLLSHFFPVIDFVVALQRRVLGLGAWSAICYPLLLAGCNVLLLPGGILCVGAGFFFGLWWGFFIVLLGNSIAAAVSFAISRGLGVRWLQRRRAATPLLSILEKAVERDARKIIFLTQLHPLFPTSLLNYLYGLTQIRFRSYMFWTTVGRAPGLFLYTYLGTLGQFGLNLALGKTHPRVVEYWMWGGAFVITALLFVLLTRVAVNVVRQSDDVLASPEGGPRYHTINN